MDEIPQICYYNDSKLNYATKVGPSWIINEIETTQGVSYDLSIAVDSSDLIHMSYSNKESKDVMYALWNGTNWAFDTVDTEGDVGLSSSIITDS